MRSVISIVVLASALAMLVPDNGAQAVNAAEAGFGPVAAVAGPMAAHEPEERRTAPDSDAAWLLALGFLGAVMARRLRAD